MRGCTYVHVNVWGQRSWSVVRLLLDCTPAVVASLCIKFGFVNFSPKYWYEQDKKGFASNFANTHPITGFKDDSACVTTKTADRITEDRLNPSQTYTATALRPLRDWQFSPIAEVATRSPIGPGEVAEKSATDRGPRCDQISRSQVFVLAQKPGCDWFGRRQVPAKSPTSRRSVAD